MHSFVSGLPEVCLPDSEPLSPHQQHDQDLIVSLIHYMFIETDVVLTSSSPKSTYALFIASLSRIVALDSGSCGQRLGVRGRSLRGNLDFSSV